MAERARSTPSALSRRAFLALAPAAAALVSARAWAGTGRVRALGGDPSRLSPFQRDHLPLVRLPRSTQNGGKVPITVEMTHPMTPDHHVTRLEVVNRRDPIVSKGTFSFTPASGRVHVAFQFRISPGTSEVEVIADCNRHGGFSTSAVLDVRSEADG